MSISIVKADVGLGIQYSYEELFLNEFEEKCLSYNIYNPFDSDVKAIMNTEGKIAPFLTKIEPNNFFLPGYHGPGGDVAAKLENKESVKVCFKPKLWRWPPFYPLNLSGIVVASAAPVGVGFTGSAAVSSVAAPLTLRVGNIRNFHNFVIVLIVVIILLVLLILRIKKKLPKRKKKFCRKCNKKYSYKMKYCPNCAGKLEPWIEV